ncbi:hypothetical protein GCM10008090_34570 [Arenicella chitinivorans]|uniref:Uncharacterized protein n=1 Tax=Arenicella chitinivorans TaxID=1329800 RepID=A0A918S532_9GAMM|nr:hypothetical protein [Arenicella chitinivorans]GHA21736.1 hypothetical protein GCM10008090_34570 [Arenicella chitinivorans]
MKKRKFSGAGTGLNKKQRSTLELWQEHMAALARASNPNQQDTQTDIKPNQVLSEATYATIATIEPQPTSY